MRPLLGAALAVLAAAALALSGAEASARQPLRLALDPHRNGGPQRGEPWRPSGWVRVLVEVDQREGPAPARLCLSVRTGPREAPALEWTRALAPQRGTSCGHLLVAEGGP